MAINRGAVVSDGRTTASGYATECVPQMFEAQVEKTPDRPALLLGEQALTFRELNAAANRIAHCLRTLGVGPETITALVFDRSLDAVVAVMGVLKAGGAYFAVDHHAPAVRIAEILGEAAPRVVIVQDTLRDLVPPVDVPVVTFDEATVDPCTDNLPAYGVPDSMAYLSYTSGSEGKPKGVIGIHRSITNGLNAVPFDPGYPDEVCALTFSLAYAASVAQLFLPLMSGVPVRILLEDDVRDVRRLAAAVAAGNVTVLAIITPLLRQILEADPETLSRLRRLRTVVVGGAALPRDVVDAFHLALPHVILHEGYASSEAGGPILVGEHDPAARDAGIAWRTFPNTTVHILDDTLQPVGAGVAGEIYIGGEHLSRGYYNRRGLTAERFIADPVGATPGARLYRTGDVAQYTPAGHIELLGRADEQVKIRGYRVAVGDVELALRGHPQVRDAAVWVHGPESEPRLVGYIVPGEISPTVAQLRDYLEARLPAFMIPSMFVSLDQLPMTSTGKVDRRALPPPEPVRSSFLNSGYEAPRTPVEAAVAQIWAELIGVDRVGIYDDFLELGGESLIASQIVARIWQRFGVEVPFQSLFERATVAELVQAFLRDVKEPDADAR